MKHYDVITSDKANADMEEIYGYIADTLLEPVTAQEAKRCIHPT